LRAEMLLTRAKCNQFEEQVSRLLSDIGEKGRVNDELRAKLVGAEAALEAHRSEVTRLQSAAASASLEASSLKAANHDLELRATITAARATATAVTSAESETELTRMVEHLSTTLSTTASEVERLQGDLAHQGAVLKSLNDQVRGVRSCM